MSHIIGGTLYNSTPIFIVSNAAKTKKHLKILAVIMTEKCEFGDLSICLSVYLFVSLSILPSVRPSIHPSINQSINQSIYLFIYHLSIYLSVCLSISLSIYLQTHTHTHTSKISPIWPRSSAWFTRLNFENIKYK